MEIKMILLAFIVINLMIAGGLILLGVNESKEFAATGECPQVYGYLQLMGIDASGLSGELALTIVFLISAVHLIGAVSALNYSQHWLMVFVSAYLLRFLMLALLIVFRVFIEKKSRVLEWLGFQVDSFERVQFKIAALCAQIVLLVWSIYLVIKFRFHTLRLLKRRNMNMILTSWMLDKQKAFR